MQSSVSTALVMVGKSLEAGFWGKHAWNQNCIVLLKLLAREFIKGMDPALLVYNKENSRVPGGIDDQFCFAASMWT